jgi:hypothetical protein
MDKRLAKISKFLSLVLRHQSGKIGLNLDEGGWANVDELLAAKSKSRLRLAGPPPQRLAAPDTCAECRQEPATDSDKRDHFRYATQRKGISAVANARPGHPTR